jgi:segregation and condensation protein B
MTAEATETKQQLAIPATLKALVEALIFAAVEPLSLAQIKAIYAGESRNGDERQMEPETIRQAVADLNKEYEKASRPYRIVSIAGGYQFATMSEYAEWLGRLYREQGRRKLSQSGVETLAIIAYKQPIIKSEVEKIRGVNCDYVIRTLLEKELVTVTGRAESVGRPLLYGTTKEFLKHFGLNDITDLPRPREIEEILGESQFETERRMLEAQMGAEAQKKEQEEFKSRLPHIPKKKSELEEKEASILPRQTSREMRIVPNESLQQESIEFNADENKQDERVQESAGIILPVNPEDVQNTETVPAEQSVPAEAKPASALNEPALSLQEDVAGEENALLQESPPKTENREEISSAFVPEEQETAPIPGGSVEDDAPVSAEHEQKHPRWKIWKEKIQGFIKKLFD